MLTYVSAFSFPVIDSNEPLKLMNINESMSPEADHNQLDQDEMMLHQAILMTEVGIDIKDRYVAGAKYVCYLKAILNGADKVLSGLQMISKTSLLNAQKIILSNLSSCHNSTKNDFDKLLQVIERHLNDIEDVKDIDSDLNMSQLTEKIKNLESNQRLSDTHLQSLSNKSVKADIDEKYPENLSKESLIDLNTIVNLPPVPEDIFTSFSNMNAYKPMRSSSLSSLKSMRKVKLFLQKAETSDEEDSSETDEHDFSKLELGDAEDGKQNYTSPSKKLLGNITEETQD